MRSIESIETLREPSKQLVKSPALNTLALARARLSLCLAEISARPGHLQQ
jgi:hypothetical protein